MVTLRKRPKEASMPKKPAKQKVGKAPAMADPILAAIDAHKEITRQWLRLEDKLDKAELCAMEKFGRRPLGLITRRSASMNLKWLAMRERHTC
jgi:hypothetical protein